MKLSVLHIEGVYSGTNENVFPSIYWMKLELIDSAVNYPCVEHSSGTVPMPTWITYMYVFDQQHTVRWTGKKTQKGPQRNSSIYMYIFTFHTGLKLNFRDSSPWAIKKKLG